MWCFPVIWFVQRLFLYLINFSRIFTGKCEEIILAFSVLRAWKKLTDLNISPQCMECLNGIRVTNMVLVAFIHEMYAVTHFVPAINHLEQLHVSCQLCLVKQFIFLPQ